jgi:putative membrane protein
MIRNYADHAANERTFLTWVRTGIAVIAFGFVIEKFNLFMTTIAASAIGEEAAGRLPLERLAGWFGHYDGLALIFGGIAIIVLASVRFVRTTWRIDDDAEHLAKSVRAELVVASVVALLALSYAVYLALD